VHYAWVVAGVSFLTLVMAAGFRSVTGVLLVPLHEAFGWSHQTISLAVSVNLLVYGLSSPFSAAMVERFGLRRVMVTALVTIALSSLLTVGMTEPWQLYMLWGAVNGIATGAIAVPLAAIVANRWFVARRGLVTGLMTASNASGQLVFLPALAWLAGFDWRYAAVVVAAAALCIVLPLVAAFVRDRPRDIGLEPFGATRPAPEPAPVDNPFRLTVTALRDASASRTFWLLAGTFFICGATTVGIVGTHLIPAAHDHGIGEVQAASLLAVIGVFDLIGVTTSGWLTDRWDPARLLFCFYALRGLSLFFLPIVLGQTALGTAAFVVVFGLDWVATVPPTVAITVAAFGRERAGVVFGWIFAAHQIGAASAAWAGGLVRASADTYVPAFLGTGLLGIAAAAMTLGMGVPRRGPRILAPPATTTVT
jgi:predicted MFS family arabinose efflux permease